MQNTLDSVLGELRGAWTFRWQGLITAWVLCLLGWTAVYSMPDEYEAMARVYVDTRTALRPLLEGLAVEQDMESQLNMVRQALLGRSNLEKVAREAQLDLGVTTDRQRAGLLASLAERIQIVLEPPAVRDSRVPNTFYRITYRDSDRTKAERVVRLVLNSFVEDTLGTKRHGSESAQKFLRDQLSEYEQRLSEAEARLAEFKKRNLGLVPGEEGGYFQRMQAEIDELKRLESTLSIAVSRRRELERQRRGETPYVPLAPASVARSASTTGSDAVDTGTRIQQTQARLDELLLRFTPKHPDVIAAQEALVELKARREDEIAALRRGDVRAATGAGAASNPVYESIQLAINQTNVEIAALQGDIVNRKRRIGELRELANTAPEVEAEYARLTRDYDVTRTQYSQLLERLERARLSEDAAETGIVRFEIVDPPVAGFSPVSLPRGLLVLAVMAMGVCGGAALAYLLNRLRPVFGDPRTLEAITGLPVFGVVSLTWIEKHRAVMQREYVKYAAAAALLFVAFGCAFAFKQQGSRIMQQFLA